VIRAAATLALLGLAVPASAAAAGAGGIVPDLPSARAAAVVSPGPRRVFAPADVDFGGGPVMHSNRTHVIFWNPSGARLSWDAGYKSLIDGFLKNVAADSHKATNVYALDGQYTDATGHAFYDSTFAGALDDTDAVPSTGQCKLPPAAPAWSICLTQAQLEAEIATFIASNGLPTGLGDLYFLVTPAGVGSCAGAGPLSCSLGGTAYNGFCGFHSWFGSTEDPTLYANIPYDDEPGHCQSDNPSPNMSSADPAIDTISHEHNESVTDPELNAWIDGSGNEIADLCAINYGPSLDGSSGGTAFDEMIGSGHYWLQEEWSNEDSGGSTDPNVGCRAQETPDTVGVTVPATATVGKPVLVAGTGNDPHGSIVSYSWDFGDGSPPASGAIANHVFTSIGTFPVTLTITDIDGQEASATRRIAVDDLTASLSFSPLVPVARQRVLFSGTGSDPDGAIATFRWNFGDGTHASGAAPRHAFKQAGSYRVTLTVTDTAGHRVSATATILVAPAAAITRVWTRTWARRASLSISVNAAGTVTVGHLHRRLTRAGTTTFKLERRGHASVEVKIKFKPLVGRTVTKKLRIWFRH